MKKPALTYSCAHEALHALANPEKAAFFVRFFKAGPGEYAEGDRFLGVMVPEVRRLAGVYAGLPLAAVTRLLKSPYNEERLLGLLILVRKYARGDSATRTKVYQFYVRHLAHVNNWNLVDSSAPYILGNYLLKRSRAPLFRLAASKNLWRRRVAVLATFPMIRAGEFEDTLRLCETLLGDREDLMHKACGWMLREIGKRDERVLREFLDQHGAKMPRTMLRYAIERFPEGVRKKYLRRD